VAKKKTGSDSGTSGRKGPHPINTKALRRLKSIEGQVRGVARMVEEEVYCVDILTQVAAARSALNRVGAMILKRHLETCVTDAVRLGGKPQQDAIEELVEVLSRDKL
jgi:DNA-binding FrmR family transcriptional regulator